MVAKSRNSSFCFLLIDLDVTSLGRMGTDCGCDLRLNKALGIFITFISSVSRSINKSLSRLYS